MDTCLLAVFGDVVWIDQVGHRREVLADKLYRSLTEKNRWFFARTVKAGPGTRLMFYMKRLGICGHSTIVELAPCDSADTTLLLQHGLRNFSVKAVIERVRNVDPPFDLKPIISRLKFINNKGMHWGTSLRSSPRYISRTDYDLIVSSIAQR